ncbi:MAG: DUF3014 domain-containing protein [Rhodanobacter sp.]|nr:DUF3014 domain-containing protein [Rhodanobacter sp.]
MSGKTPVGSWIGAVVVVLAVVVAGMYLSRKALQPDTQEASAPAASASVVTAATTPLAAIQHPIEHAAAPAPAATVPLPALADSDASVASALASLGGAHLGQLLVPGQIIPHIVATIDALPRQGQATAMLPLRPPKGAFITRSVDGQTVISERNAERYAPYMAIIDHVDSKALVAWYVHHYPLFQQAYQQLGYPKGYFNDRLVVVIDHLLAAPELSQPAALVKPEAFYRYQDPALESLSCGQKMLLRVGPANEARIKSTLRAIRSELTGQILPAAAAVASTPQ